MQEKKRKIDFQDGHHLGFLIRTNLATFDLYVTQLLPTKFRVNWLLGLGEAKNDFQDGCHGGHFLFMIGTNLAIFDLQVTPMLPTKFRVNWPFVSGEAKNRFSRWLPWWPSWIAHWHNFSYFWSTSHPDASYQVWSQSAFRSRKDGCHGGHLGFPIGTILATFDIQVTLMLPSKFEAIGLSVQEKRKIDLHDGSHGNA